MDNPLVQAHTSIGIDSAADLLAQDAVNTGHDWNAGDTLVFLNSNSVKEMNSEMVRARLSGALKKLSQEPESSTHPARLLVMSEPPSIDANEITDKG